MAVDEDAAVRLAVAQRLTPRQLVKLRADPDWRVRYEVASRIDAAKLAAMREDSDPLVLEMVNERLAACPQLVKPSKSRLKCLPGRS